MLLLEILRAQAIFMLLLLLVVVLPVWAVVAYFRNTISSDPSDTDPEQPEG